MDARTLKALRGSIQKWEGILAGTEKDRGTENCPLCQEFWRSDENRHVTCDDCPVYEKTTQHICKGSPYQNFDFHEEECEGNCQTCSEHAALAQAELDFLRSLLPPDELPE